MKSSKVAGMKEEILRQLRTKNEVAESRKELEVERRMMDRMKGRKRENKNKRTGTGKEKEKARLQVEKEKEKTRLEVEKEKEKTKQIQIEAKKTLAEQRIEHGLPESTTQVSHSHDNKVSEKDIPLFVPEEAESFFKHFEKVANIKEWSQEEWAQLFQLRLTGAAREAYTQLILEECQDYVTVENSILGSFQLTKEAYRKRFREMVEATTRTFAETARDLERSFQR
ncbi:uncharacterized protein [Procambarus clarkii]|uniref:uncharacterized protein n=1 Tax=Procambarus clarkii TaxID=6728 RepID=UPI003744A5D9